MKKINWLASYPKSGNTWMRIFFINLLHPNLKTSINQLQYIRHSASRALFDSYSDIPSSDLTSLEIEQMRPEIYEAMAKSAQDQFFLKIHDVYKKDEKSHSIISQEASKAIIYLVRNPLDLALSFSKFKTVSIDQIIEEMEREDNTLSKDDQRSLKVQLPQTLSTWNHHVKSWTQQSDIPILIVKYEDLLKEPFYQFKKVVQFLGFNYSDNEIKVAVQKSNFETLKNQESVLGFREKYSSTEVFFRSGVAGEGEKKLSLSQIQQITKPHQEMMQRFGYLPLLN
jgi:aryl sulfotransferase